MNKIILLGNLTRDPEVRYSQGENSMAIARFSLAVGRRFRKEGNPDADFFNCTCFGRQAEFVEKYLRQGSKVSLAGRVENDNYTNKNGEKVYSVKVMVEELEFAEKKGQSNNQQQGEPMGQPQTQTPHPDDSFMDIPDEEMEGLPFN